MRVDHLHIADRRPRQRLQAVDDVELHLAGDHELVLEQQVVVAMDGAADRVLERDDAMRRALLDDRLEHLVEAFAGHCFDLRSTVQERGGLAVGAGLSLIRESQSLSFFLCTAAAAARIAPPNSIAADDTVSSIASAQTGVRGM